MPFRGELVLVVVRSPCVACQFCVFLRLAGQAFSWIVAFGTLPLFRRHVPIDVCVPRVFPVEVFPIRSAPQPSFARPFLGLSVYLPGRPGRVRLRGGLAVDVVRSQDVASRVCVFLRRVVREFSWTRGFGS